MEETTNNQQVASQPATTAQPAPAAEAPPAETAPGLEELLIKAEQEAAELRDAWLRARAEVENTRKRAQADLAQAHKYAVEAFAGDLLAVKDGLESALAAEGAAPEQLKSGVELTLRLLAQAFEKHGLREIAAVAGDKFDPHRHQAMCTIETDGPANAIVNVMQKGYQLNDRVIRPVLVTVSKARGS